MRALGKIHDILIVIGSVVSLSRQLLTEKLADNGTPTQKNREDSKRLTGAKEGAQVRSMTLPLLG